MKQILKKDFTVRPVGHQHNSKSAPSLEGTSLRQLCCDLTNVSPLVTVLFHSAGIRRYLHNLSFFNLNSEPVTEAGLATLECKLTLFHVGGVKIREQTLSCPTSLLCFRHNQPGHPAAGLFQELMLSLLSQNW